MSRAIWHIAAVAPSLRSRFTQDFESAEQALLGGLRDSPDRIAAYQSVLDAWDGRFLLCERLPEWFPEAAKIWESLERVGVATFNGHALFDQNFSARTASIKARLGEEIGDSYAVAVLNAIVSAVEMSGAAGCPCVILWKSVGAVIDDYECRSR